MLVCGCKQVMNRLKSNLMLSVRDLTWAYCGKDDFPLLWISSQPVSEFLIVTTSLIKYTGHQFKVSLAVLNFFIGNKI
jgi:hypothetical protein